MRRLTILLLAGALAIGAAGGDKPPCCREFLPARPYTDGSLYQLESKWTSDVGRQIKLGVLAGRPQVLALFFTSCEYACPLTVDAMQRIEKSLKAEAQGKVDYLLISLDTERDTVDALRAYRVKQHLPEKNWTLLRGSADDVREIAALLGVNYQRDSRGQFAHSNLISVLNAEGEIAYQKVGLSTDISELVKAVDGVAMGKGKTAR